MSLVPRLAFFVASFSSIVLLLAHLVGSGRMSSLAVLLGGPSVIVMAAIAVQALRRGDAELVEMLRAGLVGGALGTLAYDLARVPMHLGGMNPFAPIRAYGMWILAADSATTVTDVAGLLYHLSNGITFGWMYSLWMYGRSPAWGVLWGLALETLAILTPFGEVFAIRGQYGVLLIAYLGHVFYGYALGAECARTAAARDPLPPRGAALSASGTVAAIAFLGWFLTGWQPVQLRAGPPAELALGPGAMRPGWLDVPAGTTLTVRAGDAAVHLLDVRRPAGPPESIRVRPDAVTRVALEHPGITQLRLPGRPWRSVFVAVHVGGAVPLPTPIADPADSH